MDASVQALQGMGDVAMDRVMSARMKVPNAHMSMQAIDKTSKDFEGMFMSQMLQPMFNSVTVNPLFGGGHGEEVMRGFLVQEYGKILAAKSRSGIAEAVKKQMIRAQTNAETGSQEPSPTNAYENTPKIGGIHDASH